MSSWLHRVWAFLGSLTGKPLTRPSACLTRPGAPEWAAGRFGCCLPDVTLHQLCPHPLPLPVFVIIFLCVIQLGTENPLGGSEMAQTLLVCLGTSQEGPQAAPSLQLIPQRPDRSERQTPKPNSYKMNLSSTRGHQRTSVETRCPPPPS